MSSDEQHIDVPVLVAERQHLVVLDRVDHLVQEALGGDVHGAQSRSGAQHAVADRVQQVRLASPSAEHEQRSCRRTRGFSATARQAAWVNRFAPDENVSKVSRGFEGAGCGETRRRAPGGG